jgi:WD40 repeat protein
MLMLTASGNTAQLWNVETGRALFREPLAIEQPVSSVAFSPDGKLVLTASPEAVQLWDVTTGHQHLAEPLSFPEPLGLGSSSVSFSTNGQHLITNHYNRTVQMWHIRTGDKQFLEPPIYCGAPVRPGVSPDGKLLVSACGQTVQLWDVETGQERFPELWSHDNGYVRSLEFSPDGKRVATASDDRTARIWDVETGSELHRLQHDAIGSYGVSAASFNPDGKRVVTTSDTGTALIWDVETGNELHKLEHPSRVEKATFNTDGSVVTMHTGDDSISRVRVWDAGTGAARFEIPVGLSANWSLGPFGKYLVTWQEESARVWHLETGEEIFSEPLSHPKLQKMAPWMSTGDVRVASISPDGRRLLTATDDETRIWMISGELLQSAVRSATVVCLSPSFRRWVLGEPTDEARKKYEACERSHGRVPGPA